jgi:hypothetical protein
MAIAPLNERQSRLLTSQNPRTEWPRYSAADVRNARLSTRARKERRKRVGRMMFLSFALTGLFFIVVASAIWLMLFMRG